MEKVGKVLTKYFLGVGYALFNDSKVFEVRSISSEIVEKGREEFRSLNPKILKADLRELDLTSLDDSMLSEVSRDIYYREWMLDEHEVQPFLQSKELAMIPLFHITSFPQRPSIKECL